MSFKVFKNDEKREKRIKSIIQQLDKELEKLCNEIDIIHDDKVDRDTFTQVIFKVQLLLNILKTMDSWRSQFDINKLEQMFNEMRDLLKKAGGIEAKSEDEVRIILDAEGQA